ncbi:MAG: Ldh family oxidoreductase [Candidatus Scalindua sp.]|jgi:ureidoglycolate dehydrogenase (NAD+)|nr:Ldh family oxidoreductase [Candidatus Scalindua sp.]MBT6049145.1 Ldh family oxidoreductase [Candidatus Scalindua sp.]
MGSCFISSDVLRGFIQTVLLEEGVEEFSAEAVAQGLLHASLRGIDSHGIRLFPHYLRGLKGGRINHKPKFIFNKTSISTGKLDGDHSFGHAAGVEGMNKAIEMAADAGSGHVAVYNSSHFGAAAFFALIAAKRDMIGMCFTNATPHVLTSGGKRAFFGNNPICFVAPCEGEEPFCLDMATSAITFNRVLQHKESNAPIPADSVADANGNPTTDPDSAKYLLPIGDYKGYGLSMMVDVLCSLLSGMPCGIDVSEMYSGKMGERRHLGQFFMALRIDCFEEISVFKKRMAGMVKALRSEPRRDMNVPVQVPGDPEKKIAEIRAKEGIPVSRQLLDDFIQIGRNYKVDFTI